MWWLGDALFSHPYERIRTSIHADPVGEHQKSEGAQGHPREQAAENPHGLSAKFEPAAEAAELRRTLARVATDGGAGFCTGAHAPGGRDLHSDLGHGVGSVARPKPN